jgi:hypothetical protein
MVDIIDEFGVVYLGSLVVRIRAKQFKIKNKRSTAT